VPGATVKVRSIGPSHRDIATANFVHGGLDRIPLLPGVKLRADDLLVLMQESAAGVSPETPKKLAFPVAPAPTSATGLPPLSFVSHVYECGQALWIGGAVPGAEVKVERSGGMQIGHGVATEDRARFDLSAGMPPAGESISTHQAAPPGWPALGGTAKVTTAVVDHIPTPAGKPLQKPVFAGANPPRGCDASVRIGNIVDGASVTIEHSSGIAPNQAIFDRSTLTFLLPTPLPQSGETLHITQAVGKSCERKPSDPLKLDVAPSHRPPKPGVLPLCPGTVQVPVTNLVPGAIVAITVKTAPLSIVAFSGMAPADQTSATFEIAPVPPSATVEVIQQNTCGQVSDTTTATVLPVGPTLPQLDAPLLECARVVRVEAAQPGAYLQVFAQTGNAAPRPISARVTALVSSVRIAVTPHLVKGDSVFVSQLACSGDWQPSKPLVVTSAKLTPLGIPFPVAGDDYVVVDGLPGAHVDIFTHPKGQPVQFLGGGDIDPVVQRIGLSRALTLDDRLSGVQTLCSTSQSPETPVAVLPASRTFTLSAPIVRESTTNAHLPLVWDSGTLVCHHDGTWKLTAHIENQETDADVDFIFQVTLAFVDAAGHQFVMSREAELSAAGNGEVTMIGYRTHGIPPEQTFTISDHYGPFRDPGYWSNVLKTTAVFDLPAEDVIWNTYKDTGDPPEGGDD
jgi:hypothetical protein